MPTLNTRTATVSRLIITASAFALSLLSCGREPTAPSGAGGAARWSGGLSWVAEFPAGLPQYQAAGGSGVAFTTVRIVLKNPDGSVALDTVVNFPPGVTELPVTLTVPLPASAPASGQPMSLSLAYRDADGKTVFTGGPITVNVVPTTPGAGPPPPSPVTIPITYTGPGATATAVRIDPKTLIVSAGGTFAFTAVALDALGKVVPNTPIVFTVGDGTIATVNAATGAGAAGILRGTTTVTAKLLTGPSDAATLSVVLPAANLALGSGGAQTGPIKSALPQPVVVRVTASDGVAVAGVTVNFAVATGGGSVGSATATTDASGNASTTWTLGNTVGTQTLTVTSAGLAGSPLTVSATGKNIDPVRLLFSAPPVGTTAGRTLQTIVVQVLDADGAVTPAFNSAVTLSLTTAPDGAAFTGTTTVTAVAGVATFTGLSLTKAGSYAVVATAGALTSPAASFTITPGTPRVLAVLASPGSAASGATLSPLTVAVRDSLNNPITTFTGPVTVTVASGPSGGTLSGTTTVNAVGGVASFSDLAIIRAGTYTLLATAATTPSAISATSGAFSILPGAATALFLKSGGGQSAAGAATLTDPIVVRVTDSFGSPVSGFTVTFTPAVNNGTVTPATATTDTLGLAQTMWTIGGIAGPQTLNVTGAGLQPNPLVVTATATSSIGIVWTGTTSSAWNVATNWNPPTVPLATDVAIINPAANATTLAANTTVAAMTIMPGASLNLATFALTVNGTLDAGTTIVGPGTVNLTGTGTMKGKVSANVVVSGTYSLAGQDSVLGNLTVSGGQVTLAGQMLAVTGDFATASGGSLVMSNAADSLDVVGNITFGGAAGTLTNGAIVSRANFTQSTTTTAFKASVALRTRFIGTVDQVVTFANPDAAYVPPSAGTCTLSCFGAVFVQKATGKVRFVSGAKVLGNFTETTATDSVSFDGKRLIVGGNFATVAAPSRIGLLSVGGTLANAAGLLADTVVYWGNTHITVWPASGALKDLQIWGSDTVTAGNDIDANIGVFGTGKLVLANGTLETHGNFGTFGGNAQFTQLAGTTLAVDGTTQLAGGLSAPQDGVMYVYGDFTASGASFNAGNTHTIRFAGGGTGTQTLTFTSPATGQGIRHIEFSGAKTKVMAGSPQIVGNMTLKSSLTSAITGVGVGVTVHLGGDFRDETDGTNFPGDTLGAWRVANTDFFGSQTINAGFITSNITISGGTVRITTVCQACLREADAAVQANTLNPITAQWNGNVTITGVSARLRLTDNELWVGGNFATTSGGTLQITNSYSYLGIGGNATFAGGSTSGLLASGAEFEVWGNFTQGGGAADAFAADSGFYSYLGMVEPQGALRARSRAALTAAGTRRPRAPRRLTPAEQQAAATEADAVARDEQDRLQRRAQRLARRNADRAVRGAPPVGGGGAVPGQTGVAFGPGYNANSVTPSTISFANPGASGFSHFGAVQLGTHLILTSDLMLYGDLKSYDYGEISSTTNQLLTSSGAYTTGGFTFNNVRWQVNVTSQGITHGFGAEDVNFVVFENMLPTADQFTIQATGAPGIGTLFGWEFHTTPTTGHYLRAVDTQSGVTDTLHVNFTDVVPYGHDGHITLVGGATTNWPIAATATWLDNESSNWDDPDNWSTGFVPDASVNIIIPLTAYGYPTLPGTRAVRNLTIESDGETAAFINLNDNVLQVYGDIDIPSDLGTPVGCGEGTDGKMELYKNGASVQGRLCGLIISAGASAILADMVLVERDLVILGNLIVNSETLVVEGAFATAGAGTLTMNSADDDVWVRDAVFAGGSTSGIMTNGRLHVTMSLTVTAAGAFAPSGAHVTISDPYAWWDDPPPVSLRATTVKERRLGALRAATAANTSVQRGQPSAAMQDIIRASAEKTAARIKARRAAAAARSAQHAAAAKARAAARDARVAALQLEAARHRGAGAASQSTIRSRAARAALLAPPTKVNGRANYEESFVDVDFTVTTGNHFNRLTIDDGGFWIGTPITVSSTLRQEAHTEFEGYGQVTVGGTMSGASTSGLNTYGVELLGALADSGWFQPDTTYWAGTNQFMPATIAGQTVPYNTVVVTSPSLRVVSDSSVEVDGSLLVSGSGQLRVGDPAHRTSINVYGNLETSGSATLRMNDHDSTFIYVDGAVSARGGSTAGLLTKGTVYIYGDFEQAGSTTAYSADAPHRTYLSGPPTVVTFANPSFSSSHFGDVYVGTDSVALNSDVFVNGTFSTGITYHNVTSTANRLITSKGASVAHIYFYNTRWTVVDGQAVTTMNDVRFANMTPTSTYFTLSRSGVGGGMPTFTGWQFNTPPSGGGRYLELNDVAPANGDVLTITMSGTVPAIHAGLVTLVGGAVLNGWSNGTLAAIASGNWNSAATWTGGTIPDPTTVVSIPNGVTVTLNVSGVVVAGLVMQGSGALAQGANDIEVDGNIATDPAPGGFTCGAGAAGGITYQPDAVTGTVMGRLCKYHSGGTITQSGAITVDSVFHVHDGTFDFNGHRVDTKEAWIGSGMSGSGGGNILMTHAGDSLVVADSMLIGDASNIYSTMAAPTNGRIIVNGNFRLVGANGRHYFHPTGSSLVKLQGTGQVFFSDTIASAFGALEIAGTRTFASPVRVDGTLRNTGTITGTAGRIKIIGGDLKGTVGSALTIRAIELVGTFADSGGFSPDTAVFTGGTGPGTPQIIPDTVGTASNINYKSIRIMNYAQLLPKSANTNWLINGKVIVDDAMLRIGGGTTTNVTIADSLKAINNGYLRMVDAASNLTVQGNTVAMDNAGNLTAGTLTLVGNFSQSGGSYQPSGTHTTVLAGTTNSVSFASAVNSYFNNLTVNAGTTVSLLSDMKVTGVLSRNAGGATMVLTSPGSVHTLTTSGLAISGNPTTIDNVAVRFADGTASTTFSNVTWTSFTGHTGTLFEIMRSSGTFTFTAHSFDAIVGQLGIGGLYVKNAGGAAVTMASSTPAAGGGKTANTGGGSLTWP